MDEHLVIGLGKKLLEVLNIKVASFRQFPDLDAPVNIPATHGDLFVYIRDLEPGKVAIRSLAVMNILITLFDVQLQLNGFRYLAKPEKNGHDLTGYEDGTENPTGRDAISAVTRKDHSSFVVVQQWQHDLNKFNGFTQIHKDHTIGRSLSDNEELGDAPASSHVNRSDQGTFDINADILRRSMPFSNESGDGLMFMAYCENLDRFEVQMKRMAGLNDGIVDALFTFSQPVNSAYFYCPAVEDGHLVCVINKT
jgi:putative iron-dependent peroxidase